MRESQPDSKSLTRVVSRTVLFQITLLMSVVLSGCVTGLISDKLRKQAAMKVELPIHGVFLWLDSRLNIHDMKSGETVSKNLTKGINSLTKIDDTHLVYSLGVDDSPGAMFELDLTTMQSRFIRFGSFPLFLPEKRKLLFYDKGDDGKKRLSIIDYNHPEGKARAIWEGRPYLCRNSFCFLRPPIQVGVNKVLVTSDKTDYQGNNFGLYLLDVDDGSAEPVDALWDCEMQLWMKDRQQLICGTRRSGSAYAVIASSQYWYYLSALDGTAKEKWSDVFGNMEATINFSDMPVQYIAELNVLVIARDEGMVDKGLYAFDLNSRKERRLGGGSSAGYGALWFDIPADKVGDINQFSGVRND